MYLRQIFYQGAPASAFAFWIIEMGSGHVAQVTSDPFYTQPSKHMGLWLYHMVGGLINKAVNVISEKVRQSLRQCAGQSLGRIMTRMILKLMTVFSSLFLPSTINHCLISFRCRLLSCSTWTEMWAFGAFSHFSSAWIVSRHPYRFRSTSHGLNLKFPLQAHVLNVCFPAGGTILGRLWNLWWWDLALWSRSVGAQPSSVTAWLLVQLLCFPFHCDVNSIWRALLLCELGCLATPSSQWWLWLLETVTQNKSFLPRFCHVLGSQRSKFFNYAWVFLIELSQLFLTSLFRSWEKRKQATTQLVHKKWG